jgi:hypothetical protein
MAVAGPRASLQHVGHALRRWRSSQLPNWQSIALSKLATLGGLAGNVNR